MDDEFDGDGAEANEGFDSFEPVEEAEVCTGLTSVAY